MTSKQPLDVDTSKVSRWRTELMDKLKPTFDLATIKSELGTETTLRLTTTADKERVKLGLSLAEVAALIRAIKRAHFYKSMTSHMDHTVWQDVYRVPHGTLVLYVKFTVDGLGKIVISFKEK